jgi:hypothetical protein
MLLTDCAARASRRYCLTPRPWWATSSDPFALVLQLQEPVMYISFQKLLDACSAVLGRDVDAHELRNPKRLQREIDALYRRVA